jgi:hypothetical protein
VWDNVGQRVKSHLDKLNLSLFHIFSLSLFRLSVLSKGFIGFGGYYNELFSLFVLVISNHITILISSTAFPMSTRGSRSRSRSSRSRRSRRSPSHSPRVGSKSR